MPAARAGQRSMAAPSGIENRIAGTEIAPIRTPMSRWLRPNLEISSGTSGGTAKKVTPTEKKLTTVDARISQRREARSGCVMAGIIQALGRGDRGASGPIIPVIPTDRMMSDRRDYVAPLAQGGSRPGSKTLSANPSQRSLRYGPSGFASSYAVTSRPSGRDDRFLMAHAPRLRRHSMKVGHFQKVRGTSGERAWCVPICGRASRSVPMLTAALPGSAPSEVLRPKQPRRSW